MRLQELLPGVEFVDSAELLWTLRRIKSISEISYMRRAAEITSIAYSEVYTTLHEGMSEREVYTVFLRSTHRQGAERLRYVPIHSRSENYC
jgi:Xaa-Pro aminopeptidase